MNDDKRFEELKEKEIKRLTDSLGKANPVKGILTDDEILKYAGDSISASKIRLKRGVGTHSDKVAAHDDMYLGMGLLVMVILFPLGIFSFGITGSLFGKILFFLIILIVAGYYVYVMFIQDYTEPQYKQISQKEKDNIVQTVDETRLSNTDELLLLFESKEKIAREMIERKFPAPQMTNTKFNGVLDNCKDVVESQIEILNTLTLTEKTKYEISSRKKLIKQVISKLDDLTNELILSEENNLENVIDEMDNLIKSVKDYKN